MLVSVLVAFCWIHSFKDPTQAKSYKYIVSFCPHLRGGGYPISGLDGGYPIPDPDRGTPSQVHIGGYSIPGPDRGVPHSADGGTPSKIRMGYPRPDLGWGIPAIQGWMGTPHPNLGWDEIGYPPQSKTGWGTPLSKTGSGTPHQRLDRVPPHS